MKITRAVVPSLFTVLNIFCGFLSLIHTAREDYILAAWFVVLAALFDTFDGIMARITKSSSDFGVEFDSLSDVVSFGVAPSFLLYNLYLYRLEGFGMLISSMPMIFGALRLARFNAQSTGYDKEYFRGLPIPAAAITLCSFVINYSQEGTGLHGLAASILVPMVVILSLLMITNIKYDTVPKFTRRGMKQHPLRFTLGVASITAILLTKGAALFPIFVFYVATGPLRFVIRSVQQSMRPSENQADEKEPEVRSVDV